MKHEPRYRSTKGANRIARSGLAPWLQVLFAAAVFGAVAALFVWVLIPLSRSFLKGDALFASPTPLGVTASPSPTAPPTPDPAAAHDLYGADLTTAQTEIVVPEFQYLADVTVYGDSLVFAVGNYTTDGTAAFVRLCVYDVPTDTRTFLALPLRYKSIRFPKMNERWIVYQDAKANGGGRLVAWDRETQTERELKTVHTGLVQMQLWGDTAVWMERTGQTRDKLFACDLNTGESVTLDWLDNSPYALSEPCFYEDTVVYVDAQGALVLWDLHSKEKQTLQTGTYVHDPKYNGELLAYLDGNHGEDTDLYLVRDGVPVCVAESVVDFALGDGYLAYSRFEKNYVYFPETGATFCCTRSNEKAMLLGAGGRYLLWMDVTWRDKDILEFMEVG